MPRHVPLWLDRFPKSRRPDLTPAFAATRDRRDCRRRRPDRLRVRWSFAAAGVKAIVLEADRIGAGSTAALPD